MFDPARMRVVYGALAVGWLLGGGARVGTAVAQPTGSAAAPRKDTKPDPVRPAEENYEMLYTRATLLSAIGELENYLDNQWYCTAAALYSQVVDIAPEGPKLQTALHESVRLWESCLSYADYGREMTARVLRGLKKKPPMGSGVASSQGVRDADWLLPRRMDDIDQKMFEVYGAAIAHQPESAELIDIKYRLACIYHQHNYFDEAAVLFKDVAENHPRSSTALAAACLVLDCLAGKFFLENKSRTVAQSMELQVGKFLTWPALTNDPNFVTLLKAVLIAAHGNP